MGRSVNFARQAGTNVPMVISAAYATGQTFKKYAFLIDDVNGELVECGADPVAILGVSMQDAGSGRGYGVTNSANVVFATGRLQEVSYVQANRMTEFSIRGVNGGTDPVLPLRTHIGEKYGVAKVGNDWVMDMAEVTVRSLHITDITEDNFFLVKIVESFLARP